MPAPHGFKQSESQNLVLFDERRNARRNALILGFEGCVLLFKFVNFPAELGDVIFGPLPSPGGVNPIVLSFRLQSQLLCGFILLDVGLLGRCLLATFGFGLALEAHVCRMRRGQGMLGFVR